MGENDMNNKIVCPETEVAMVLAAGDLVPAGLPALRARLREAINSGVLNLTLDMAPIQMVDSTGIGLLISAHNSLQKTGGKLAVINVSHEILDLFRTMRIHQHFSVSGN